MSTTPTPPESEIHDALVDLWVRREPRIRAELVELRELVLAAPEQAQLERAKTIAHDLAGLCGVFGHTSASESAREFELLVSQTPTAIEIHHLLLLINAMERQLFGGSA
jgi:hypothetical protein